MFDPGKADSLENIYDLTGLFSLTFELTGPMWGLVRLCPDLGLLPPALRAQALPASAPLPLGFLPSPWISQVCLGGCGWISSRLSPLW